MPSQEPTTPNTSPPQSGQVSGHGASFVPRPSQSGSGVRSNSDADSSPDADTRVADATPRSGLSIERIALGKPRIEDYVLLDEIHRGGQGVVYRALQVGTKRQVALKVLLEGPFAGDDSRRRFEREVELAASLKHPNIVTILDSGISEGRYYFAMEYIEGFRLDQFFREKRPGLRETLALLEQICDAVNFAHQRGVIHRDLKPSNILVDNEGQSHVLDFGLAKQAGRNTHDETTIQLVSTAGQILGTVAYMSPEQAAAPQDVDVRSDVYSLGVIFYEILLGQPPYVVSGPLGDVLNNIARAEPVTPRSVRMRSRFGRQIDDELTTILLKCLEKEPARRYQTAGDLGRDLRRYLDGEAIEAKRASGLYMLKKNLRRYRVHVAVAGVILLMLLSFLLMFAYLYTRESYAGAEADRNRTLATENAKAASLSALEARQSAEGERTARREAERAAEDLRGSLVRQRIQQGDLARERGDLAEARDSYWSAYGESQSNAALWNLRQYYVDTGELSSHQLYLNSSGPVDVAPDGKTVATCNDSESLAVRDVDTGETLAWFPLPGKADCVVISAMGKVAATGNGWARAFSVQSQMPELSFELPIGLRAESIQITRDGGLLITSGPRIISAASSGALRELALPDPISGQPDYSETLNVLAVPHRTGVDLISFDADGSLRAQSVWKAVAQPPRAVRFSGDDLLAILAAGVEMVRLGGDLQGQSMPFFDVAENWDMLDLGEGVGTLVLGNRDGKVSVYKSGTLTRTWRVTHGTLRDVHFVPQDGTLVTLDGRGTLTRWSLRRDAQPRLGQTKDALAWAVSADGSTIALMDSAGRTSLFTPATDVRPRVFAGGRFLSRLPGSSLTSDEASVAITGVGDRVLLRRGSSISVLNAADGRVVWARAWNNPEFPVLRLSSISTDGSLIALVVESQSGEQQRVAFFSNRGRTQLDRTGRDPYRAIENPVTLSGSRIRDIQFLGDSAILLVNRISGAVDQIEPGKAQAGQYLRPDAPAALLAQSAGSTPRLAALGEDGVLRLFCTGAADPDVRIVVGTSVASMTFNPAGDALLVRNADGEIRLFDAVSGEAIVRWSLRDAGTKRMVAWLARDVVLVDAANGVLQYRYGSADETIRANRRYARQRAIIRELERGDFAAAWTASEKLLQEESGAGLSAQAEILELLLRRPTARVPSDWVSGCLAGVDRAPSYLRLAFAAYKGRRFDQAHEWLARAAEIDAGKLDAYSDWKLAQCDYLAEKYSDAAARLAGLLKTKDLQTADVPLVQLELTAALFMADRMTEARAVGLQIGGQETVAARADRLQLTTARSIGRYIAGVGGENLVIATFSGLLANFAENSLAYHDDPYFFFGELARKRGELDAAATQYRRCIDTARDEWPSNWAIWRLQQLRGGGD